jgi:hypothetical protein
MEWAELAIKDSVLQFFRLMMQRKTKPDKNEWLKKPVYV